MTRAEKAGLEAYPENIGYSAIGDTIDCNAEKRRVFIEGYEQGYKESGGELLYVLNKSCAQGYKDAVRKAYDWLIDRYENQGVILLEDINELKQVFEESK